MVKLDLDILTDEVDTIKLFGKEVKFRNLNLKEHFKMQKLFQQITELPLETEKQMVVASEKISEYLMGILELTQDEADRVSLKQFKALQEYMQRKEFYDQGFSDEEIDQIQKDLLKKKVAALEV